MRNPAVALFYSLIESAKLCGVESRACPREATLRAVRNPGWPRSPATAKRQNPESELRVDRLTARTRERTGTYDSSKRAGGPDLQHAGRIHRVPSR